MQQCFLHNAFLTSYILQVNTRCLMLFSMSHNWLLHRVFWAVGVIAKACIANPNTAATAVLSCRSSTTPTDLAILNGTE